MTNTWILTTNERIVNLAEAAATIGGTTAVITVAPSAPAIGGVDTIIHISAVENVPAGAYVGVVVGPLADAKGSVILAANYPAERSFAGATAAALALPVVVGTTSINAEDAEVTHYGGLTNETVTFKGAVLVLEGGTAPEAGGPATQAHGGAPMGAAVIDVQPAGSGSVSPAAARRIVPYRHGFRAEEDFDLTRTLTKALGAEIACSRPLARDTTWLSRDHRVGVSGMHVAPDVYVALGIPDQMQRTSGMADSKVAVVINSDANALILRISGYGIVGDIYDVVPAFTAILSWNEKKNVSEEAGFDVIVIDEGAADAVCAYTLAEQGWETLPIERAAGPGSKNLSDGVFYCRVMEKVFPNFVDVVPVEHRITRNCVGLINASSFVNIDYWDQHLSKPINTVTVLRVKLDAWPLEQCEEAGVTVMPGMKIDSLIVEGEEIVSVRAGEDELRSHVVVTADRVNSFIAQQVGIRAKEPMRHLAAGTRSVIELPHKVLESCFNIRGKEGVAYAMVGDRTQGVAGGGFLYTDEEFIPIGVVIRLDDLEKSGSSSSDVHDHTLRHPAIAPLLEDDILLEYGRHLTIRDDPAMASHDLARPGLIIIGDAVGFTLNTGLTIRDVDLAAGSALAAAEAIRKTFQTVDFSQEAMNAYRGLLDSGFVSKDIATYTKIPTFLECPHMYKDYGKLAAEVLYGVFNHDLKSRCHMHKVRIDTLKASGLRLTQIIGDILAGACAL